MTTLKVEDITTIYNQSPLFLVENGIVLQQQIYIFCANIIKTLVRMVTYISIGNGINGT